jgi:hypothetical protein
MALMAPDPAAEDEFNAWYDREHIPERLVLPGFISATRYESTQRRPDSRLNYLAVYELDGPEALSTPGYLGLRPSTSTKQVTGAAVDRVRVVALDLDVWAAELLAAAPFVALQMPEVREGAPTGTELVGRFRGLAGLRQSRLLDVLDASDNVAHVVLHYLDSEVDQRAARALLDAPATFGELYRKCEVLQ